MKDQNLLRWASVVLFSLVLCFWSTRSEGAENAPGTTPSRWKDDAAAKADIDKMIASAARGETAATLSCIVLPAVTNPALASLKAYVDNWSGDLRSGCYSTRTLCVKTDGTWGIAFFAHLKGNLEARAGASNRFVTCSYWAQGCHKFPEGWKLLHPSSGQDIPGYDEYVKAFMKDARPLHDAVKQQFQDVLLQGR